MKKLNDFRKELELATQGIPRKHPQLIADLKKKYTHSISLRSNPNMMDPTSDCFLFVFEEYIPEELVGKIRVFSQNSSVRSNVFQNLLDNGFIELHDDRKTDDRIVVYFDKLIVTHFGKIERNKILSKWGAGLIWEHPVFEVPLSYGNAIRYSNGQIDIKVLEKILSAV
jgi:hypothetical protein